MIKHLIWTYLMAVCGLGVATSSQWASGQEPAIPMLSQTLPLSSASSSAFDATEQARAEIRERVRFQAEQRVLRAEWNHWIGYSPARPTVNASHLSNGRQLYYVPARGQIVNAGASRMWHW